MYSLTSYNIINLYIFIIKYIKTHCLFCFPNIKYFKTSVKVNPRSVLKQRMPKIKVEIIHKKLSFHEFYFFLATMSAHQHSIECKVNAMIKKYLT